MRRARGFTYLALLIFIAVMSLASVLTLEVAQTSAQRSAEAELAAIGREFNRAFAAYYRLAPEGAARFPSRLQDLLLDPRVPTKRRFLRRIYADPLSARSEWGTIPAPGGGIMGVYSLAKGTPRRHLGHLMPGPYPSGFQARGYATWVFGYNPMAPVTTAASAPAQR